MKILTRDETRKLINRNKDINYVYALIDTSNKPFYIGKGTNGRVFTHLSSNASNKGVYRKVKEIGRDNVGFYIYGFTSDYSHALRVESKLIKRYDNLENCTYNHNKEDESKQYINLGEGIKVEFEHKTMRGSLTDLVKIGNSVRIMELDSKGKNKPPFNLAQFLKTKACRDYIAHLQRDEDIETPLIAKQRGKDKGTYGHLYLMLYVAQNISDRFATKVIKVFVHDQILQLRDQGGNDFKNLNKMIDTLEDRSRELKPKGNRGCYIQVAKMLREKIFTKEELESEEGNIWNSSLALSLHQEKREDYENKLVTAIDMGFIKTYTHLKEVIEGL